MCRVTLGSSRHIARTRWRSTTVLGSQQLPPFNSAEQGYVCLGGTRNSVRSYLFIDSHPLAPNSARSCLLKFNSAPP